MVFAEDCAKAGFWDTMTLFPMKLGLKLDRLTIGVLPIKTKLIYILNTPTWIDIMMKMMKPFLSAKMRKRIILVKDKDHERLLSDMGSKNCIPEGFGTIGGTMVTDVVTKTYYEDSDNVEDT